VQTQLEQFPAIDRSCQKFSHDSYTGHFGVGQTFQTTVVAKNQLFEVEFHLLPQRGVQIGDADAIGSPLCVLPLNAKVPRTQRIESGDADVVWGCSRAV